MVAEMGGIELLIIVASVATIALFAWTLATAATRRRWGWFLFVLLVPALAMVAFWLVNPPPLGGGPRAA